MRKEKREHTTEETMELLRACEKRDKAAVFELTRRGVRADAQDPLDARTPLHAAVTAGSADLLILLLSSCPGTRRTRTHAHAHTHTLKNVLVWCRWSCAVCVVGCVVSCRVGM